MSSASLRSGTVPLLIATMILAGCGSTAKPASGAPRAPAAPSAPSAPAPTATAGSMPTVRVGYCCTPPDALPLILAERKGMYKAAGVKVIIHRFLQGSATVAQALAAGQIDVAEQIGGPDAVLRMVGRGAKVKMIGTEEKLDPVWLYAKPSIKSVVDLKGKTVVVGGLGGPLYTYGVLMLMSGGLHPTDVKLIQNGNNEQRTALLASGRASASTISMPGNFTAKQDGFRPLVYLGNVLKSAIVPWVASDQALRRDRTGIVRFLKAIHTAQTYIARHPRSAAAVYAKMTKSNPAVALKSIKLFLPYYGWSLHMKQLLYVFQFDEKVGTWRGATPTASTLRKYMDTSLTTAAGG